MPQILFSRIYEKLMVHSDLSKAESWMRLTEEFLNSPLPNTDGVKVGCIIYQWVIKRKVKLLMTRLMGFI